LFLPLHISIICEIDDNCLLFVCWEAAIDHSHTVIVSLCFIVRMWLRFSNVMLVVFIFFGLLFSCISTLFWWHELGIWIRYVSLDLFAFFMCIVLAYHTLIEKWNWLLKINSKCVHKVSTKITTWKINDTRIFVNEVETQDEKNHSGAAKPRISTIQKTNLDRKQ
jgi:hypothetical protein